MIIPKGKKFYFYTGFRDKEGKVANANITPSPGSKGNSYISQDISFTVTNNFTTPLAGILDRVPHIADAALMAQTGVSLRNNRVASMKYWTGTEPMEINFQFTFETQVDSYYDVYLPVMEMMELALPTESPLGFYQPPVSTLSLISQELKNTLIKEEDGGTGKGIGDIGIKVGDAKLDIPLSKWAGNVSSWIDKSTYIKAGQVTDLVIGGMYHFKDIIIKSVSPTFSQDMCYAPIHFYNSRVPEASKDINSKHILRVSKMKQDQYNKASKEYESNIASDEDFSNEKYSKMVNARGALDDGIKNLPTLNEFNPNTKSASQVILFSQIIGSFLAGKETVLELIKKLGSFFNVPSIPSPIQDALEKVGTMDYFPISATVNMTIELQFPLSKHFKTDGSEAKDSIYSMIGTK